MPETAWIEVSFSAFGAVSQPNTVPRSSRWPVVPSYLDARMGSTYYTGSESAQPGVTMVNVATRFIAVTGMTCDHCAGAVRAEIGNLPGVTGVDVDVAAGTVRISGDPLPGDAQLRRAVEEAGYEFAG